MSMATESENITTIRENLLQIVADKTAGWIANGCPPTYSIDGISVDWGSWLASMTARIKEFTELQQPIEGPFTSISRVRG